MAEIYEGVTCAICRHKIDFRARVFATSGIVFAPEHRLFKFADAPMHWNCYERWPDRAEFASAYFQAEIEQQQDNPYWEVVLMSEDLLVSVGFTAGEVIICLAETYSDIRVPLSFWNLWIRSKWIVLLNRPPLEKRVLSNIWSVLKTALPNTHVLMDKANRNSKRRRT